MNRPPLTTVALLAAILLAAPAIAQTDTKVVWNEDATSMSLVVNGETHALPDAMLDDDFPQPGAEPHATMDKTWPVFTYRLKWSVSTAD